MPPKRKKSARRERQKLIVAVVLGIALLAILLWPADDSSEAAVADAAASSASSAAPSAAAPRRGRAGHGSAAIARVHGAAPAAGSAAAAEHAPGVLPTAPLPRLDLQKIAAADPFVVRVPEENSLQSVGSSAEESLAALPAQASVRAVYRTSRGAAAIVDGQIIPVKDANHWITTLRAADLQD